MPRRLALLAAAVSIAASGVEGQAASPARGSIAVTVVDTGGRPFEGASIAVDSGVPRQTRADGILVFPRLVPGAHQVEVFAIGMKPHLVTVELVAGARAEVKVRFERIPGLAPVRVIASRWQRRALDELPARMAKRQGQFRDSTQLGKRTAINSIFVGLRGVAPSSYAARSGVITGIRFGTASRTCGATVFIDGYRDKYLVRLNSLLPQDIAIMEVYDRRELVPFHFTNEGGSSCAVVAIWTKELFP